MQLCWWFVQYVFMFIGLVVTYAPLILDYGDEKMWTIDWHIWALIGVTILWMSLGSIILRLYFRNRRFLSKEHQLDIQIKERQLHQLEQDQKVSDIGRMT